MEQREFLETIHACRRRLNLAGFLKKSVFALSVGAGVGILFQLAAFVVPFYYVNLYTGLALLLAVFAAFVAAYVKRVTTKQAALVMDGFGFEERIVTAYEHLNREGTLIELQREDALRQLRAHKERIHIPILPSARKCLPLLVLLAVLIGLALAPSAMKERAGELHHLKEIAKEKEEEIEDVLEALGQLEQEELTPEQQAALQDMIESLQSSLSEYKQAYTADMLATAAEKLDYKYENMSSHLAELAQMLENGAEASPATVESMQAMAENLQKMSGKELAKGDTSNSGKGQNAQGGQGNGNGNEGNNQGGKGSTDGNKGNAQGGQGSTDGNGGSGEDGQGSAGGSGQGSGEGGQGDGGGSGEGSQGNGDGNGGNGEGGSGNGRGTGSSSNPHDYVSVPNAIAESGNLLGNAVDHDASDYFRAQNGLSWEGLHISHEAVIGSYEQNAYEGIAAGRYPSGMEDVIKQYFASFN